MGLGDKKYKPLFIEEILDNEQQYYNQFITVEGIYLNNFKKYNKQFFGTINSFISKELLPIRTKEQVINSKETDNFLEGVLKKRGKLESYNLDFDIKRIQRTEKESKKLLKKGIKIIITAQIKLNDLVITNAQATYDQFYSFDNTLEVNVEHRITPNKILKDDIYCKLKDIALMKDNLEAEEYIKTHGYDRIVTGTKLIGIYRQQENQEHGFLEVHKIIYNNNNHKIISDNTTNTTTTTNNNNNNNNTTCNI